jgi:hypothetical protein
MSSFSETTFLTHSSLDTAAAVVVATSVTATNKRATPTIQSNCGANHATLEEREQQGSRLQLSDSAVPLERRATLAHQDKATPQPRDAVALPVKKRVAVHMINPSLLQPHKRRQRRAGRQEEEPHLGSS